MISIKNISGTSKSVFPIGPWGRRFLGSPDPPGKIPGIFLGFSEKVLYKTQKSLWYRWQDFWTPAGIFRVFVRIWTKNRPDLIDFQRIPGSDFRSKTSKMLSWRRLLGRRKICRPDRKSDRRRSILMSPAIDFDLELFKVRSRSRFDLDLGNRHLQLRGVPFFFRAGPRFLFKCSIFCPQIFN